MGLFSFPFGRRLGSSAGTMGIAEFKNGPGTYDVDVVDEGRYQDALERIRGRRAGNSRRLEVEVFLVPEDDNPYDSKAVQVLIDGQTVGHLDRVTARSFRKSMSDIGAAGMAAKCKGVVVGGWNRGDGDKGHVGVKIDLPTVQHH